MAYDINAMKARLTAKTADANNKAASGSTGSGVKYFKPQLGPNNTPREYDIRFSPTANTNGEPIQTIAQYKNVAENIGMRGKLIAPSQFGLEDPIAAAFELRRNTDEKGNKITKNSPEEQRKAAWAFAKNLQPVEFAAAQILDRSGEDEWLLWEFNTEFRDLVFATLMHKDYVNEQMFDAEVGYDFTLTVSHKNGKDGKPSFFNGYPVKDFKLVPRRKPSKLHAKADVLKKLQGAALNLEDYYKKMLLPTDKLLEKLDEFVIAFKDEAGAPATSTTGFAGKPSAEGTEHGVSVETVNDEEEDRIKNMFASV